jgi:hypothetical protein
MGEGGWQARAWDRDDDPENCEVLCVECYAAAARGQEE